MSFFVLLLYIICTFLRPQDWVSGLAGKPIIDILVGAMVLSLIFERRPGGLIKVPQNKLILGFYVAILMSHIAHTYFGGLTHALTTFLPNFILYFLILNGINTQRKFKVSIWLIVLLIVILVPQGMYQLEHGYGWADQRVTFDRHRAEFRINWVGIFNDPNDLALIFVVVFGILVAFLFGKTTFVGRIVASSFIAMLLYGIVLTNSRGGLVALMATAYFYFIKRTNRFFWGSIVGGVTAFALFAIGPSRKALFNIQEASAFNRIELWYQGVLMMKANPLFGVGYRMFTEDLPQTAHNSYVLAGAELGLMGLFFWMALIYSSYKGLSLVQEHNKELKTYALGLQSALVGFCAAAFFLSRTYIILPYFLFALSGSLMHITQRADPSIDFRFTKKDITTTLIWSIGVMLMMYVLVKIAL